MKTMISALLGTTALAAITLGVATPAQARGDVGVYVGPGGFGVSIETYRNYCRDPWYRHRYWRYCHRFYDDDDYGYGYGSYYNNYYYYDDDWRWRHRRRHDRDDWGGEGDHHRHGDWDDHHHHHDGGEGDRDRDRHW